MSPKAGFGKSRSLCKPCKPAHTVLCKHLHNIVIGQCLSAVNAMDSRCVCFVPSSTTQTTCVCATSACEIATGRTAAVLFKECTASSLGNHFP